MATLSYEDGLRRGYRLRVSTAAGRKSIWLGRIGQSEANAMKAHVEHILSAQTADLPLSRHTEVWFARLAPSIKIKIAPLMGLFKTVEFAIDRFLDEKSKTVSASTLANIEHSLSLLTDEFGQTLVQSIDRAAIKAIADKLSVSAATRGKIASHWRQFFRWCCQNRFSKDNAADQIAIATAVGKKAFVSQATILKILAACTDPHLRAAIAFSRWGGIRIPSELYGLSVASVDLQNQKIAIHDAKRKTTRAIPIFPELREHLPALNSLPESSLLSLTASGIASRFQSILRRLNIAPWPRLWHSLRASRESELIKQFGINAACTWIGNSERVAIKHYLLIDDQTWELATRSNHQLPETCKEAQL